MRIIPRPFDTEDIKSTFHLYLLQLDWRKLNGDIQDFKVKIGERDHADSSLCPLYRFSYLKQFGYDTEAIRGCPNAEEAFLHKFTHLPSIPSPGSS